MSRTVYVLNGPNLHKLGVREPDVYGNYTLDDVEALCRQSLPSEIQLEFRQTNHEGELVDWVHEAQDKAQVLVLNAAAYTHTSVALHDALKCLTIPVLEVHLSQPHCREPFRHQSFVSPTAKGIISGFGIHSYRFAMDAALMLMSS